MNKEFTKTDLEDGMVVEQRNGNMYLVLAGKAVRKGRCNRIDGYTDDWKMGRSYRLYRRRHR